MPPAFILSQDQTLLFGLSFFSFASPAPAGLRELLFVCLSPSLEALDWWSSSPQGSLELPPSLLPFPLLRCYTVRFSTSSHRHKVPVIWRSTKIYTTVPSDTKIILSFSASFVNTFFHFLKKYFGHIRPNLSTTEKEGFEPSRRLPGLCP